MRVSLPRIDTFDLDNVPSDFREQVQRAFSEYTAMTASDYTYQDKLRFIDACVEQLHYANEDNDIEDMIVEWVKYELYEQRQLPENDDVFGYDGLIQAYRVGKQNHRLYSREYGNKKHDDEKCMKLLIKIIKAVMDYERR